MNKSQRGSGSRHGGAKTRIAIMGATSHIAKGLINNFVRSGDVRLFLFARRAEPVYAFLREIGDIKGMDLVVCENYQNFSRRSYDCIINCVGLGTVSEEPHIYTSFFMVTEEFDNLALSYLTKSPGTRYINFSSGAVYGGGFPGPSRGNTLSKLDVNRFTRDNYFTIAKLNSEAKHRAFAELSIIDIRVFSYFSRFVDITGKYFITEMLYSLVHNKVFRTSETDIVRDYIHPEDLFALIRTCLNSKRINTAFDAYSRRPVGKKEILEFFATQYNLKYKTEKSVKCLNVTGPKLVYYSLYRKAGELGYRPQFSSMETVKQEALRLLQRHAAARGAGKLP